MQEDKYFKHVTDVMSKFELHSYFVTREIC